MNPWTHPLPELAGLSASVSAQPDPRRSGLSLFAGSTHDCVLDTCTPGAIRVFDPNRAQSAAVFILHSMDLHQLGARVLRCVAIHFNIFHNIVPLDQFLAWKSSVRWTGLMASVIYSKQML